MASFHVRAFAAASCVSLLAILLAGPAQSSLISKNLLKNGNAELGAAAVDAKSVVKPQSWLTVGSFVARGCRTLRVTIASPGGSGTYDDAYADNVALRLLQ